MILRALAIVGALALCVPVLGVLALLAWGADQLFGPEGE